MNKINYSILVSLLLVLILFIQESPELWPGIFFLMVQGLFLFILHLIVKAMHRRKRFELLPVIRQFQYFFGIMFPIWIGIAVFGLLPTLVGRIYALALFIIFFSLCITLMIRLFISSDLLDRFK